MSKWIPFLALITLLSACQSKFDLDTVFNDEPVGCGNFSVSTFNDNLTIGLCVYGDSTALNLSETPTTFSLDTMSDITVVVDEFKQARGWFNCNELSDNYIYQVHRWEAQSGEITLSAGEAVLPNTKYLVNISLSNVVFKHESRDEEISLTALNLSDVHIE